MGSAELSWAFPGAPSSSRLPPAASLKWAVSHQCWRVGRGPCELLPPCLEDAAVAPRKGMRSRSAWMWMFAVCVWWGKLLEAGWVMPPPCLPPPAPGSSP